MPARLLVIGLDAMEAPLIEAGAADGSLPTFAALTRRAATYRLTNPMWSHPGAIWPEINTGRSVGSVGLFFHPCQIHTGEPVPRIVEMQEIDSTMDWWHAAGDAGRRVLVFDVPHSIARPGTNGIHITDWGNHDRSWPTRSEPPHALDEVRAVVGDHPIGRCDAVVASGTPTAYSELVAHLLDGVDRRTRIAETLMASEAWDVVHVAFTESHCVGHQLWAFNDPTSPMTVSDAPPELRTSIATVYRAIDDGIARLVAAAGPDVRVMIVASHGMGPYVGGYQLLPEVLIRLGMRARPDPIAAMPSRLPPTVRSFLRRTIPDRTRWRRTARAGVLFHHDLASSRTKAAVMLNNRCGAIRLNLRGREPDGLVEPGAEADALVAMLRDELFALRLPGTDQRIVATVDVAREQFGSGYHPDLPDLTVGFRQDLGPIEACESPRIGRIEVPLWSRERDAHGWPAHPKRTGDHTDESRLWVHAPGVTPTTADAAATDRPPSVQDVGPTALWLLDVPVPAAMDGRVLPLPDQAQVTRDRV